jgi:hypothetical protein
MNLAVARGLRLSCRFSTLLATCVAACGLLLTLAPSSALAIIRIGNAKFGSESLGFEASLSKPFVFLRVLDGESALLVSQADGVFRAGEPLVVKPLDAALPDIEGLTRAQFRTLFEGNPKARATWRKIGSLSDGGACLEAYIGASDGRLWGVAAWGSRKGIVFSGNDESFVRTSVEAMIRSVVLQSEGCEWK